MFLCLTLLLGTIGTVAALETKAAAETKETVYDSTYDVKLYRGENADVPYMNGGYVFAG